MDFRNVFSKRCHDYRFADKNPRILGILEKTSCFLIAKTSNIYIYIYIYIACDMFLNAGLFLYRTIAVNSILF